jgi:quercetin dioxygenase-like cupin family protein
MAAQQPAVLTRTDLQQHDLSAPGREVVQNIVEIGPEAPAIKHRHPGEEIIYVLQGAIEYQIEGDPPVTVSAGEVFFVRARAVHTATNAGTAPAKELATYVVEKDEPLVEVVQC